MVDAVQKLEWDTQQLGIPTARIMPASFELSVLREILKVAKQQGFRLLYYAVSKQDVKAIEAAEALNGILVDHKVTYVMDFPPLPLSYRGLSAVSRNNISLALDPANKSRDDNIKIYTETIPCDDLLALAYESGKYSRFRNDPHITETQFHCIYSQWIANSVNHTIADKVFIIQNAGKILGMITVGEKNQRGDIGLLAVDKEARGRHMGTKLVYAAQQYFMEKNYATSQVVTQEANQPACRLYGKCGYTVEKIEYFFHFWV